MSDSRVRRAKMDSPPLPPDSAVVAPATPLILPLAVIVDVIGCPGCPFVREHIPWDLMHCELADMRPIDESHRSGPPPAWCPLRVHAAVVRYAGP